jgi:hypothetical protein
MHLVIQLMHKTLHSAQCNLHTNKDWISMQPLDRINSVNDVFELIIYTYNFSKANIVTP